MCQYGMTQEVKKDYLVLTFEKINKKELHRDNLYYWIIPVDSLNSKNKQLYPFYIEGYSNSAFMNCKDSKAVNFFIPTKQTNWDFSDEYLKMQEGIFEIIKDNRHKILTSKNKWDDGLEETLNVYITPITGVLCNCELNSENQVLINYHDKVYLPISDIQYLASFWPRKDFYSSDLLENFNWSIIENSDFR